MDSKVNDRNLFILVGRTYMNMIYIYISFNTIMHLQRSTAYEGMSSTKKCIICYTYKTCYTYYTDILLQEDVVKKSMFCMQCKPART